MTQILPEKQADFWARGWSTVYAFWTDRREGKNERERSAEDPAERSEEAP